MRRGAIGGRGGEANEVREHALDVLDVVVESRVVTIAMSVMVVERCAEGFGRSGEFTTKRCPDEVSYVGRSKVRLREEVAELR